MLELFHLFFLGLALTTLGHSAKAPDLDPFTPEGRKAIESATPVSKPAPANFDDVDPKLPIEKKIDILGDVNATGDQCRAVLGPIPRVNCLESPILPVRVGGHEMTYENGVFYEDGKPTKWRPEDGCDHPGLLGLLFATTADANPKEGCLPNARLGGTRNGNVDWAWVCHNLSGYHEKTDKFDFVTLIGNNRLTGETCFFSHSFDGEESRKTHGKDLMPPGGIHPESSAERLEAGRFWDSTSDFSCIRCHMANNPWVVSPHTNQSRVLGDGTMDIIPELTKEMRHSPGKAFRIIGTVYNASLVEHPELRPKAIYPKNDDGTPDKSCTRCHVVTNQENFLRLARFAVGLGELPKYAEKTKDFVHDPKPWMPPLHERTPEIDAAAQAAVKRYERAFYDPKWRAREADILSPCPAPEPLPFSRLQVIDEPNGMRRVEWTYRNDYGGVPLRDDVRFEVTLLGQGGSKLVFRDVAPESLGSEHWRFVHPLKKGAHYSYRLKPYRYCFEETVYRDAPETWLIPSR